MKHLNIKADCKKLGIQTPLEFYKEQMKVLKGCPDGQLNYIQFWKLKRDEARNMAAYQLRHKSYGNFSYMYHVEEVARYSVYYLEDKAEQLIAEVIALLHDVEEDGDVTYNDIKLEFGEFVAEAVHRVSDERGRSREARKPDSLYEEMKEMVAAVHVKLADRLSNAKNSRIRKGSMGAKYKREHAGVKEKLYTKGVCERLWRDIENFVN